MSVVEIRRPPLSVAVVDVIEGLATIGCTGSILYNNASELDDTLTQTLEDDMVKAVHLDMSELVAIDSVSLGVIIDGYKAAKEAGKAFAIRNPQPRIANIFSLPSFQFFDIEQNS